MVYVAFVFDVFSRRILGWRAATKMTTPLVLDCLEQAIWTRGRQGTSDLSGLVHHTDAGSQYTSIAFTDRLVDAGIDASVGSVGDAYDNAMCESFFATLECELLDRRRFKNQAEAQMAIFEFIEGFYNTRRRHSALDYDSPIDYERRHALAA